MPNGHRRHDTAIRAAFDAHRQQEEGARHAVRIAGQRQQSALAGILGSRSPHQKRIIEIHKEFRKEIATVPADGIASFLLHYACCEASARILIAASNGKPPHKAEGKDIALNSLNHALEKYQIIIDPNLVRRVFAEAFPSFATASASPP